MMQFKGRFIDEKGKEIEATFEASDQEKLRERLESKGWKVIELQIYVGPTNHQYKSLVPLIIVGIILLFLSIFPWPYGYYTFLKLVIFGLSLYLLYLSKDLEALYLHRVPLILIALLVNPIFKVSFHHQKFIWTLMDYGIAAYFIFLLLSIGEFSSVLSKITSALSAPSSHNKAVTGNDTKNSRSGGWGYKFKLISISLIIGIVIGVAVVIGGIALVASSNG